jgi:hypothetical protein
VGVTVGISGVEVGLGAPLPQADVIITIRMTVNMKVNRADIQARKKFAKYMVNEIKARFLQYRIY